MRRRPVSRRVMTTLARLLLLGVVAGLATASSWWPSPERLGAPALEVEVEPGRVQLVCPGPPRLSAQDEDFAYDPAFDPAPRGSRTTVTGFTLGRDGAAPAGAFQRALSGDDDGERLPLAPQGAAAAHVTVPDVTGFGLLRGEPGRGSVALLAGLTVARTDAGDLRGLVGQRCIEATESAWLVAGSTQVGNSARLVLGNPGATPATVRLAAWGGVGPVDLGQAAEVLVPAGAARAVLLEGAAPDEARLAVQITVAAGQVAAFVQDSALTGFVPAGVDLVAPAAEPSRTVLVPGLVLPPTDIDADDAAMLRIVNPGDDQADVELRLLHPGGEVTIPGAERVVVDAGTVTDVSLAGVPSGPYAAELVSDRPVTAAAMLTRVGEPSRDDPGVRVVDRAWMPAAHALTTSLVPLPAAESRVSRAAVVVSNPAPVDLDVEVRVVLPEGEVRPVEVRTVRARSTVVLSSATIAGAVGVHLVSLPPEGEDAGAAQQAGASEAPGHLAAAVLVAEADDGPLVMAVSAQRDLERSRSVAVRLPHR